ncbi:MAG: guanylate kinase [Nitrospirae bacterium]|nr:guanylate kinase [Nitrospirota bacterium]
MPRGRGLIFVVSAPSGTGKSTVVSRLLRKDPRLARSVSWTTRGPRPGERIGRDYEYVTPARFRSEARRGAFIEWKKVFGFFYGTPMGEVKRIWKKGKDVVCVIDVKGGRALKRRDPSTVLIFMFPPSMRELEHRLRNRGALPEKEVRKRLRVARDELLRAKRYDYRVTNNDIHETVDALRSIVAAERQRVGSVRSGK